MLCQTMNVQNESEPRVLCQAHLRCYIVTVAWLEMII